MRPEVGGAREVFVREEYDSDRRPKAEGIFMNPNGLEYCTSTVQ